MGYQKTRKNLILFTLFTGWIGGHRYYLKQYTLGVLYTLFFWTYIPFFLSIIDLIVILRSDRKRFMKNYYRSQAPKNVNHFQEKTYEDYPYSYSLTLSNLIASLHFTPENLYVYKWLRVPGQPVKEGELICHIVVEEPGTGRHLLWKLASPREGILQYFVASNSRITHEDVLGFILYKPLMLEESYAPRTSSLPKPAIELDMDAVRANENPTKRHPILAAIGKSIEHDILQPLKSLPIWTIPGLGSLIPKANFSQGLVDSAPFSSQPGPSSQSSSPMTLSHPELVEAGGEGSF